MKSMVKSLILTSICFSSTIQAQSQPRGIYPFGFGGLETLEVNDVVDLLMEHGYTGILPEVGSRSQQDIRRLKQYLNRSALEGEAFNVMGIYTNHKIYLEEHGYDNSFQKQMIDILANRGGGTLWMAVRAVQNQNDPVDYDKVNQFIQGVFEYAIEGPQDKNVDIIFYPHVNNAYESTVEALTLVEEINHPKFKISINLIHEYHAGRADSTSLSPTKSKNLFLFNAQGRVVHTQPNFPQPKYTQ